MVNSILEYIQIYWYQVVVVKQGKEVSYNTGTVVLLVYYASNTHFNSPTGYGQPSMVCHKCSRSEIRSEMHLLNETCSHHTKKNLSRPDDDKFL